MSLTDVNVHSFDAFLICTVVEAQNAKVILWIEWSETFGLPSYHVGLESSNWGRLKKCPCTTGVTYAYLVCWNCFDIGHPVLDHGRGTFPDPVRALSIPSAFPTATLRFYSCSNTFYLTSSHVPTSRLLSALCLDHLSEIKKPI